MAPHWDYPAASVAAASSGCDSESMDWVPWPQQQQRPALAPGDAPDCCLAGTSARVEEPSSPPPRHLRSNGMASLSSRGLSKFYLKSRSFDCLSDAGALGCASALAKPEKRSLAALMQGGDAAGWPTGREPQQLGDSSGSEGAWGAGPAWGAAPPPGSLAAVPPGAGGNAGFRVDLDGSSPEGCAEWAGVSPATPGKRQCSAGRAVACAGTQAGAAAGAGAAAATTGRSPDSSLGHCSPLSHLSGDSSLTGAAGNADAADVADDAASGGASAASGGAAAAWPVPAAPLFLAPGAGFAVGTVGPAVGATATATTAGALAAAGASAAAGAGGAAAGAGGAGGAHHWLRRVAGLRAAAERRLTERRAGGRRGGPGRAPPASRFGAASPEPDEGAPPPPPPLGAAASAAAVAAARSEAALAEAAAAPPPTWTSTWSLGWGLMAPPPARVAAAAAGPFAGASAAAAAGPPCGPAAAREPAPRAGPATSDDSSATTAPGGGCGLARTNSISSSNRAAAPAPAMAPASPAGPATPGGLASSCEWDLMAWADGCSAQPAPAPGPALLGLPALHMPGPPQPPALRPRPADAFPPWIELGTSMCAAAESAAAAAAAADAAAAASEGRRSLGALECAAARRPGPRPSLASGGWAAAAATAAAAAAAAAAGAGPGPWVGSGRRSLERVTTALATIVSVGAAASACPGAEASDAEDVQAVELLADALAADHAALAGLAGWPQAGLPGGPPPAARALPGGRLPLLDPRRPSLELTSGLALQKSLSAGSLTAILAASRARVDCWAPRRALPGGRAGGAL